QHAVDGAEVLDEPGVAVGERAVPNGVVDGDVGSTEAVDRLLGIADHGQASRPWPELEPVVAGVVIAGDAEGDVRLDGVSVLELVYEDDRDASSEVVACLPALGEHV